MSLFDDDDWEMYQGEDSFPEEVIYIDGVLHNSHEDNDSLCDIMCREYRRPDPPMDSLE